MSIYDLKKTVNGYTHVYAYCTSGRCEDFEPCPYLTKEQKQEIRFADKVNPCRHCGSECVPSKRNDLACIVPSCFHYDDETAKAYLTPKQATDIAFSIEKIDDENDSNIFSDFEELHSAFMRICPHPAFKPGGSMGDICTLCGSIPPDKNGAY